MAAGIGQLILFRVQQGLGGGMTAPVAFAMTYRLSPPDRVGKVMAAMGLPILIAPALVPVLSGYLVDNAPRHWIFLIRRDRRGFCESVVRCVSSRIRDDRLHGNCRFALALLLGSRAAKASKPGEAAEV